MGIQKDRHTIETNLKANTHTPLVMIHKQQTPTRNPERPKRHGFKLTGGEKTSRRWSNNHTGGSDQELRTAREEMEAADEGRLIEFKHCYIFQALGRLEKCFLLSLHYKFIHIWSWAE